jgi:hypothetical protein
MERQSLKSYVQSTEITSICKSVRENTNGYPFITVLRGSDAENIYFSIKASAQVTAGQDITTIAKDLYVVTDIQNEAGESRTKLSFEGNSNYVDASELF